MTEEYVVQSGDNLTKIANKLSVDLNTLVRENNITNPNLIKIGDKLKYSLVSSRDTKLLSRTDKKNTTPPLQPTKILVEKYFANRYDQCKLT